MPKFTMTQKCTFMPLNVLSTPIPFGIRNGIIWTLASKLFKYFQAIQYSTYSEPLPTLYKTKPIHPKISLTKDYANDYLYLHEGKDLTKDKYLQIEFYDGVFRNIKNQKKNGFDLKT